MQPVDEKFKYKTQWRIRRYEDDAAFARGECYDESVIDGNLLLNEGIQLLEDLLIGAGGTAYNNASAYLGVGDSSTAESAAHTGLQAATNKTYKAMQASYPSRASQTITWRSVFASGDANYAWNEFTIVNASTDSGTNLNRKVSSQGTKASGQTWTLDMTLTIS
jgi:hypothetical protein